MNATVNIFLKDFRRFWPIFLVYHVIFAAQDILAWGEGAPEWIKPFAIFRPILLRLGMGLGTWLIIYALQQEDAASAQRPFWLSRPVTGLQVYWAKMLSIAGVIVMGSIVSHIAIGLSMGESLEHLKVTTLQVVWGRIYGPFVAFCIFALSRSLIIYLLVFFLEGMPPVILVYLTRHFGEQKAPAPNVINEELFFLLIMLGLSCMIVTGYQYATRKTKWSWVLLGVLCALSTVIYYFFPLMPIKGAVWG